MGNKERMLDHQVDMKELKKIMLMRESHNKLPSRLKTKRNVFLNNTAVRDNIDKVAESRRMQRFIPNVSPNPNAFAASGLKFGGPLYMPTNKHYGNFRDLSPYERFHQHQN